MTISFEQAREQVARLVKQFQVNRAAYLAPTYNEGQARQQLIDPLFIALGWDVHNEQGAAPNYLQVEVQTRQTVGGHKREPDYVFQFGKRDPKFFVEAKKPGVSIKSDPAPSYQLRAYAWNARLPLSILTDFEEFATYNCRIKPRPSDKASSARLQYYTCEQYPEQWREIWDVFSYEAVRGGSFDQFLLSAKSTRGGATVDADFLETIEEWRRQLAQNIELRNSLSADDLTDAVQRTIDRIIFLRIAEDRDVEPPDQLQELARDDGVYKRLVKLFKQADGKYNSGLFDFEKDKRTPALSIDDKPLRAIIGDLYGVYNFRLMPVEILGNVYEQFLGKVIRVTAGGHAKVEAKPEVRKAGGVYYTPQYIVDYIVRHSVGKLVEGKTPKEVARLRILDMACGSGSFLLGAYQYLLDWHLQWYSAREPHKQKALYDARRGTDAFDRERGVVEHDWRLTTDEKKRILLNNIYGVDIDRQAVEVTKLSLLLKVLEDEQPDKLQLELLERHEPALPDLDQNIKCGNSLIGPDYFAGRPAPDLEESKRVNPFDWQHEFPKIMQAGGFDAVIGNPPYVRIQAMKEWAPREVEIYKQSYQAASSGNYDIYVVFVEKALSLLNARGRVGFILPHKFFNAQYGKPLRGLLSEGKNLEEVVHFGDEQVFAGATTYTCLLFLNKNGIEQAHIVKVDDLDEWRKSGSAVEGTITSDKITPTEWNFAIGPGAALFEKLDDMPVKLGDVADIFVGLQTSADTVFLFKDARAAQRKYTRVYSKELGHEVELDTALLKSVVRSGNIGRYFAEPTAAVLFPYHLDNGKSVLISESEMQQRYSKTWEYLNANRHLLAEREHGKFKHSGWYQLYPKNLDLWDAPKILIPYMIEKLAAYYDTENLYFVNVTTGGFGLRVGADFANHKYVTGLLNSTLLDWYLKNVSTTFHGGYFAANKQFLVQLPMRPIDFSDAADRAQHERMVALVEQMLELHRQLHAAGSDAEREVIQRQVEATDRQIDELVYALYGLNEDEIRIVEGE